jgi:hypothetical protein
MKSIYNSLPLLVTALFAAGGPAYAQQPPDVVVSDPQSNTAMGTDALNDLAGGVSNTASGAFALLFNSSGNYNTATGVNALQANTTGGENAAFGVDALYSNNGSNNAAFGTSALLGNTSGNNNTACGVNALLSNANGSNNTACGYEALYRNTGGGQNTAFGVEALHGNTKGSSNIAAGYKAGFNLTTGSNNIDIGNEGMAADSGTVRIGTNSTQTTTYIAGIYGTSVSGSAVMVSSNGQLGVTVSSERFKTDITPMGSISQRLQQLRPVTFHLKTDPKGTTHYGLIAEEVAKVYPELVIRSESGRIDGVRYDELAPMLLNEVQKQAAEIRDLKREVAELIDRKRETRAALIALKSKDRLVAQR